MSIALLAEQVVIFMSVIGLGLVAQRASILDEATTQKLSALIMNVTLPCTLLHAADSVEGDGRTMLACAVFWVVYYVVMILIMELYCKIAAIPPGKRAVINSMVVFPNVVFIGVPMVQAVLGKEALVYTVIAMMIYNFSFLFYVPPMFSKGERVTWRSVFTPVNVSAVLMGVMIVANLRLPSVLDAIVGQAGQVTMPLALMIIGAMLGRSDLLRILRSRELYLISALRLLVVPAVVAYITFRLGWPPMLRMVCIIGAACPAGNLAAVVALQKDTEAAFASEAVVHSTMWSVLTMPVVIWCAGLIP